MDRDQYRDDQRIAHELELERLEQRVEHRHGPVSIAWIARRRAASMPRFGRRKTARKVSVSGDDDSAGRAVQQIAGIGADEACHGSHCDAYHGAGAGSGRSGIRDRAGRHHHAHDEEGSDRLQRRDRRGGQQREEHDPERSRFSPIERAWVSSKKVTIRSFHLTMSTASETKPMMASCRVSSGVIARMLPSTMVWMFTEVGESDTMKARGRKRKRRSAR